MSAERRRLTPSGEPMERIPDDDDLRGMFEGLCFSCMCTQAEWRDGDEGWQECDECAFREGEDEVNEAKRNLNRARRSVRYAIASGKTSPMAMMVLTRISEHAEAELSEALLRARGS